MSMPSNLRRCKPFVMAAILAVAALCAFTPAALHAQAPFYQGKTLTVINGNEPGGTGDLRMRAVLPFFKKHIPGSPTVVAEYMPGGGGRKVANHIHNAARPDGLTMAFPPGGFVTYAIFKETGVNYDINKLIFVGSPESATQYVFLTRKEAGLNSLEKLKAATGVRIGAQSVGHTIYIVGRLFAHVLRLKDPRFITGYSGPELDIVLTRGEIDGRPNIPDTILKRSPDFIKKGTVDFHAILEIPKGDTHPLFKHVPEISDLAASDVDRKALTLFRSLRLVGSPFILPPATPKDRADILREAFRKTAADPEFRKEFKKFLGDEPSPLTGEAMEKAIHEIPIEDSVIDFFKQISGSGPLPRG
jgi:tripartite-type tricarboxylate transporter receptor subunit TctC